MLELLQAGFDVGQRRLGRGYLRSFDHVLQLLGLEVGQIQPLTIALGGEPGDLHPHFGAVERGDHLTLANLLADLERGFERARHRHVDPLGVSIFDDQRRGDPHRHFHQKDRRQRGQHQSDGEDHAAGGHPRRGSPDRARAASGQGPGRDHARDNHAGQQGYQRLQLIRAGQLAQAP